VILVVAHNGDEPPKDYNFVFVLAGKTLYLLCNSCKTTAAADPEVVDMCCYMSLVIKMHTPKN
jgi:hypothetical protein